MMRTARQSWGRTPDSGRMPLPVALPLTAASNGTKGQGDGHTGEFRGRQSAEGGGRGGRRWPGLHSGKEGK